MANDYHHTMVFVTRWLARLVDGETTEAECISVLRHYPGPWENGRANIPADISDADSHHFVVREGRAPRTPVQTQDDALALIREPGRQVKGTSE